MSEGNDKTYRRSRGRVPTVHASSGASESLQVHSTPTGAVREEEFDPEVVGLLQGLSDINPALNRYLDKRASDARGEGEAFASAGGTEEEAEEHGGRNFVTGYITGTAKAAAIKDGQALLGSYETEMPKDSGDINEFISKKFDAKMQGADNPAYKKAYEATYAEYATKLRQHHGEGVAKAVIETNRANAQAEIDHDLKSYVLPDGSVDPKILARFNELADERFISNPDRNQMLFNSLNTLARDGNAKAFDVTKLPRNGVPGMYNIPEWKAKIDGAIEQAENAALTKLTQRDIAMRKKRADDQDAAVNPVIDLFLKEGPVAAQKMLTTVLADQTLFPHASDRMKYYANFSAFAASASKPEEAENFNEAMLQVLMGKTSAIEIMKMPGLNGDSKVKLVGQQRAVDSERRSEASAARVAGAQVASLTRQMDADSLRADVNYLQDSMPHDTSIMAQFDGGANRILRAELTRQYIAAAPGLDPVKRRLLADEMVAKYNAANEQQAAAFKAKPPPYTSWNALLAAQAAGKIPPEMMPSYTLQLQAWEQAQPKTK